MPRRHAGDQGRYSLKRTDRAVLRYLERMARRNYSSTCTSSIPKIARACEISTRQVQISVGRLIAARLVERMGYDLSNPEVGRRGTIYKVLTVDSLEKGGLSKHEVIQVMTQLVKVSSALHGCIDQLALLLNTRAGPSRKMAALRRRLDEGAAELAGLRNEKSKRG